MEVKKAVQIDSRDASGKKVFEFFGSLKKEFKNVAWTPKDELEAYTKIVVAATFIFGFLIYVTDLVIQGVLNGFGLISKLLSG